MEKNLLKNDRQFVWHPFTSLASELPVLEVHSAKDAVLHTSEGEILDCISSWWVNLHGHANPVLAEALYKQASKLEHVIFAGFTHEPAVNIAETLVKNYPGGMAKAFFSDNGSTAVEVALKLSLQYFYNQGKPRHKVIAIEGAYHGDTFGAMSVAERNAFSAPFAPWLAEVDFIPFPTEENEEEVIAKFRTLVDKQEVAAFIAEPLLQGSAGMRLYKASLLDKLICLAKENGTLFIADEVFTGFGRTGKLFAMNHCQEQADIACLSKGITGGFMPLGVTLANPRVVEAFQHPSPSKTFYHGHSYTANPLACALANASFSLLTSEKTQAAIANISQRHQQFVLKAKELPGVRQARSLGTLMALEMETGEESGYFSQKRDKIYLHFLSKGLLMRPLGNVIYLLPPYCVEEQQLDKMYQEIWHFAESWN